MPTDAGLVAATASFEKAWRDAELIRLQSSLTRWPAPCLSNERIDEICFRHSHLLRRMRTRGYCWLFHMSQNEESGGVLSGYAHASQTGAHARVGEWPQAWLLFEEPVTPRVRLPTFSLTIMYLVCTSSVHNKDYIWSWSRMTCTRRSSAQQRRSSVSLTCPAEADSNVVRFSSDGGTFAGSCAIRPQQPREW